MKSVDSQYKYYKYTFQLFCLFTSLSINILDVKGSDIKNETQISEEKFSSAFKGYSTMFEEEDINSNLRKFFGLNPISETRKINYPDLSITNDSKNLRELYDSKLNQMTSKEDKEIERIELFFKEKL